VITCDQPAISMGHAAGKSVMHGSDDLRSIAPRGILGWFAPSGALYETVRPRAPFVCMFNFQRHATSRANTHCPFKS